MKRILFATPLILLGACSSLDNVSEQGQTKIEGERALHTVDQVPYTQTFRIIAGKEYASFLLTVSFDKEGKPRLRIKADGVKAFEGQKAAAEAVAAAIKSVADAGVAVTPAIVDGIVKAVTGL